MQRNTLTALVRDDRGVSEVMGAILVFGLVVMLLTIIQTQAVPDANEEVEFEHNHEVQQDLTEMQEAISRTAVTGSGESVSVNLGTTYPPRMIFFSPGAPSGSLRTTESRTVTVTNVEALDADTRDYISGSIGGAGNIESRSIVYQPNYNLYHNAPETIYDNTVLANDHENGGTTIENRGSLVSGREISLVTIAGDFSESRVRPTAVNLESVSGPTRTVSVESTGNPDILVPTRLSEDTWKQEILAEEFDSGNSDPDAYVQDIVCLSGADPDEPCNGHLRIKLDETRPGSSTPIVYNLRMARVGVGQNFDEPEAHYVTSVGPTVHSVGSGHDVPLTVEVRDRFNNPVSDERIKLQDTNTGNIIDQATSNANGRVTFEYSGGSAPLLAGRDTDDDGDLQNEASKEVVPIAVQSGSSGPVTLQDVSKDGTLNTVSLTLRNEGATPVEIERVQLGYFSSADVRITVSPGNNLVTTLDDGSDRITDVKWATNSRISSVDAYEGEEPKTAQAGTIPPGSSDDLELTFDDAPPNGDFADDDFIIVRVTVYYQGGYHETYAVHLPSTSP